MNVEALNKYSVVLEDEIAGLEEKIYLTAGRKFNIGSPKQLGVVLFEEMQLVDKPKKTSTGQYSTREAELLRLAPKHEIVADILEFRTAMKLKSVYVDQLPAAVNPRNRSAAHALQSDLDRDRANAVDQSKLANDSSSQRTRTRDPRGVYCSR